MGFKDTIRLFLKKCFKIGPEDIDDYRKRGVKIGKDPELQSCAIDYGHGYLIEIGDYARFSHVTILTHDASTKKPLGYSKIGSVKIGNDVFIGYGSIILPGTTIGDNVVIGAGSVVKGSIPSNSVAVGNPAVVVCTYDEYIEKNRKKMETSPVYDIHWSKKTKEDKIKMIEDLAGGKVGFDV